MIPADRIILLIICSIVSLSCIIFLIILIKFKSILYVLGIKHVVILQFLNLLMSISMILQIIGINLSPIDCKILGLSNHFFGLIQSYWVFIITRYNYKIISRNESKDSISIIKPLVLGIVICSIPPFLTLTLGCFIEKHGTCFTSCQKTKFISISSIMSIYMLICSFLSTVFGLKAYKQFKKKSNKALQTIKWALARLIIYPFITLVFGFPWYLSYTLLSFDAPNSTIFHIVASILLSLTGVIETILFVFTPEIKIAIDIHRDIRRQSGYLCINSREMHN